MNPLIRHKSWFVIAALAVSLAACSGGTSSTPPVASQALTPTSALAGVVTATSAGTTAGSAKTDVCALLPADQVAQVTGLTIGAATPRTGLFGPNDFGCVYGDNDATIDVVSPGGTAFYNDLATQYYAGNYSQVAGFGDKAFQDVTDGSGLVALFGDSAFDVYIDNPGDQLTDAQVNTVSETLITDLRSQLL